MNRAERRRLERQARRELRKNGPGGVTAAWLPSEGDLDELFAENPPGHIQVIYVPDSQGVPQLCTVWFDKVRCLLSIDEAGGHKWYHVSVSRADDDEPGLPSWEDLKLVRSCLFRDEAQVIQVFPPADEWFTAHEVLHLWQRLGPGRVVPDLRKEGQL